ncbi:DNA-binding transcriptional LysR family regulator [Luteibacter sp. HA06]|jgi:DNA-binding transcriptional LysR family regulator
MLTFVRVVETGSFSAAARVLKVGQPAVSKVIAQLEQRLNVRLLVRSTHGLRPTEAGQRFFDRARVAVEDADEAERAARDESQGLSGRLRVSAATTFARLHIVPHLPAFLAAHPDIEVDIVLDDRMIDLMTQGIDLSLRMGNLADSSLVAQKLATGRRSVVATPAYLQRAGEPTRPEELATHEAVVYSQLPDAWVFERAGEEVPVVMRGRARFSAAEGIRAAVLADMGLAVTSDWMFADKLIDGSVRRLLPDWNLPSIDLWVVYPSGRMASAKARAFTSFVQGIVA